MQCAKAQVCFLLAQTHSCCIQLPNYTVLLKDGSEFIDSIDVSFNFVHLCVSETKLLVSRVPYNGFDTVHRTQQPSLFIMFSFIKQQALKPFCVDFVCNMKMLFELKKNFIVCYYSTINCRI